MDHPGVVFKLDGISFRLDQLSGADLSRLRYELHLTQAQFGELLNVHPLTVSRWERETQKAKAPGLWMFLPWAEIETLRERDRIGKERPPLEVAS